MPYIYAQEDSISIEVVNHKHIMEIIIPFYDKYTIHGKRSQDYSDFKQVSKMIETKEHLTQEGYDRIIDVKSNMNDRRE